MENKQPPAVHQRIADCDFLDEIVPSGISGYARDYIAKAIDRDVAMTCGADGIGLLAVIATLEETFGSPVSLFNTDAARMCGSRSTKQLMRVRDNLVQQGWLRYTGNGGSAGTYRTEIPNGSSRRSRRVASSGLQHVYFIGSVDGPIKIGIARDPKRRLKSLQTSSPIKLSLLAVIPRGGAELEKELHERFQDDALSGEWFRPSPELLSFVDSLGSAAEAIGG